jgi:hypothetical protein
VVLEGFIPELRKLLVQDFGELHHPLRLDDPGTQLPDIENTVDVFLELLHVPNPAPSKKSLGGLEPRVINAFHQYLHATGMDKPQRLNALANLTVGFETFVRKLVVLENPQQKVRRSELAKWLVSVGRYSGPSLAEPVSLAETTEKTSPGAQGTEGSTSRVQEPVSFKEIVENVLIHDAYQARNMDAHEMGLLNPAEETRYWVSVVSAFLVVSERNRSLATVANAKRLRTEHSNYALHAHLEQTRARFADSSADEDRHIRLQVTRGATLDERVDDFLAGSCRLLLITGRTGAGKTTSLERLCGRLADRAIRTISPATEARPIVPLYFELKRYRPGRLCEQLCREFVVSVVEADKMASWPALLPARLAMCLDGLDEADPTFYSALLIEIESLARDFDNVQIIVTTRPHGIPAHWSEFVTEILPLTLPQIEAYFGKHLPMLSGAIQAFLAEEPDLVDILQDPLMTEAAWRYWTDFEAELSAPAQAPEETLQASPEARCLPESRVGDMQSPTPPNATREILDKALLRWPLLESLYRCFFNHHLRRVLGVRIIDYEHVRQVNALAQLALKVDGDARASWDCVSQIFVPFERNAPQDQGLALMFMDIGLLKAAEANCLAFRNETVKAYFAAVGVRSRAQSNQLQEALAFIKEYNRFWRCAVGLIEEAERVLPASLRSHLQAIPQCV